jgi:hypothetical protein
LLHEPVLDPFKMGHYVMGYYVSGHLKRPLP